MKIWQILFVYVVFCCSLLGVAFSGSFFIGSIAAHDTPNNTFFLLLMTLAFSCNTAALGLAMRAAK